MIDEGVESDSDDDIPKLSESTQAALNSFYKEREENEQKFKLAVKETDNLRSDICFEEDWQLSQFWYDDATVLSLTKGALNATSDNAKIALISCPTLYKKLASSAKKRKISLLEFDRRFLVYGSDFQFYDYNSPQDVPQDFIGTFDLVIVDPPFLSEECLIKIAITVKLLTNKKIVLCTGATMNDTAQRLLKVKKCQFEPHHKNNLANEFWCYSNFDFDNYI